MRNNLYAVGQKLLKIGLLSYVILLFFFFGIKGSIETSYAMSSQSLHTLVPLEDTPAPTATPAPPPPTATPVPPPPTATPVPPRPTATPTQPPRKATPVPPGKPVPTAVVPPPVPMATETSATATPISTPKSVTPTVVATAQSIATAIVPASTIPDLQNADNKGGMDAFTLSLILGVGAPLVLISGGTAWFLVRWLINRRKHALEVAAQEAAQANPWMNNYNYNYNYTQPPLHALKSASGAALSGSMPARSVSEVFPTPTLPAQPTYTPSDLRPIATTYPQQLLNMHANGVVDYPSNGDLRLSPMASLDLSLEVTRAIETNGNGQMPLLSKTPPILIDTPTSSMPSSPPISQVLLVESMPAQAPSVKDDSILESVMRQAQMGLFALPGREKSLTH